MLHNWTDMWATNLRLYRYICGCVMCVFEDRGGGGSPFTGLSLGTSTAASTSKK